MFAMKRIVVRYKTKPDQADENACLIENVFKELNQCAPAGLRYAALRLADGVSFIHVASVETPDGTNPVTGIAAFKTFQAGIKDRCVEPPQASDVTVVGDYRLFGG
jgi:hypothetical protein